MTRIGALLLASLAIGACSDGDGDGDGEREPLTASSSQALIACPARDALFELPGWAPSCPAVGGWNASPLFSTTAGGNGFSLDRICRYSWAGQGTPSANDFGALTNSLQIATNTQNTADPDCPVVAPLGLVDLPEVYGPMIKRFHQQASRVPKLPVGTSTTRVAVIDGAALPYSSLSADTHGHGRAVGRVIHDLMCPPGGFCAGEIRNYLALPMLDEQTANYYQGGYFGTRGQLAEAIERAVEDWVHDYKKLPSKTPPRLVINLSVGWTPEHDDQQFANLPSRAVFQALQHAACHGALVVAAVGNDSGDGSTGPMFPGAWERYPAPTKCGKPYSAFPSKLPRWPAPGAYAPIVHAASAVDGADRPSATMRAGGQSRLVAYGTNVVTKDVRSPGRTLILSGTSMASAIASGAAAVAWAYKPSMTADQVMKVVYGAGVQLTPGDPSGHAVTNVCLNSSGCSSWPLRRVSVCNIVKAFVGPFSIPFKCATPAAHSGDAPDLPSDLSVLHPMPSSPPGPFCSLDSGSPSACGTEGDTVLMTPWVDPQPSPGCDLCTITIPTGDLWLDLVASHLETIVGITFVGYDARGNAITSQRILSPTGGSWFPEIFRSQVYAPTNLASAELHFAVSEFGRISYVREPLQVPRY